MTTSWEMQNMEVTSVSETSVPLSDINGTIFNKSIIYQSANLLVQPFKGVGLDSFDFIPVEREYLQRVESVEGLIVDSGDFVVVQVQYHQAVKVVDRCGRNRLQVVLRHIQLRQFVA
jgi:hypothetical protein